jgi:glutamate-1-semialdehyde 2,1-aminomutase
MTAGYAALQYINKNPGVYSLLEKKSAYLENGIRSALHDIKKRYALNRVGSMMTLFFVDGEVNNFKTAIKSNTATFGKYFNRMLEKGIYLAPAQFEAIFVSTVHNQIDLDKTINSFISTISSLDSE